MRLELVVETGAHRGSTFSIDQAGTYRLGRDPKAKVPLIKDKYVSRRHCEIELNSGGAWLRHDEGSSARAYVNGVQIEEVQLANEDRILIGRTVLRVSLTGAMSSTGTHERPIGVRGFNLVKKLPTNGPGQVWWAYADEAKQLVTLHFLLLQEPDRAKMQERFLREVDIRARLRHRGLPRFLEHRITDNVLWFATELSELSDELNLRQFVEKYGPLSVPAAVEILTQALDIIAYLHSEGVVHRSLRPDSLIIKKQSDRFNVHLDDLSSAKRFQTVELQPITKMGQWGYLPHSFIASRAWEDPQRLDPRDDLYALGTTLYFALTGSSPDYTSVELDLTRTILEPGAARPILPERDLPPKLLKIIERTMGLAMEAQYTTAQEMSDALHELIKPPPPRRPIIKKSDDIALTTEIEAVLRAMFSAFNQIAIETEFGHGLSGGRAFRVHPAPIGRKIYLPVVVKIAPTDLIRQEWQAYQDWVEHTLPGIAQIEAPPDLSSDQPWAGLRYSLAGGGVFEVQSLETYSQKASADELRWLLEKRLFKIIGENWWLVSQIDPIFQMQSDYDSLLPVNLLLEATAPPPSGQDYLIEPDHMPPSGIAIGDLVQLKGFVVTELDLVRRQLTLNLPPTPEDLSAASYRLRLIEVSDIQRYHVGQRIHSIHGIVKDTRHSILVAYASQALGETVDLSAKRLTLPINSLSPDKLGQRSLPNPLLAYQDILQAILRVKISTIHGDLNLENILVDPDTRYINLIDFATARQGHALYDLLRLETEVMTKLFSAALAETGLSLDTLPTFYEHLHRVSLNPRRFSPRKPPHLALEKPWVMLVAIRQMAQKCLSNPDDWREYYYGLALYLLGALKFKNLDKLSTAPLPKRVAFWGAATSVDLLQNLTSFS